MPRRPASLRWSSMLLIGLFAAGVLLTLMLPSDPVAAAQKRSLAWLSTRVVDRNGRPVDATVVIQGPQNMAGRTDRYGVYKVAVVPGTYLVTVISATQTTPTRRVTVVSGRSSQVAFRLTPSQPASPNPVVTSPLGTQTNLRGDRPAKIRALKASPTATAPGGSSSVTAQVDNPTGTALTYSWRASGGKITGTAAQALWVAPQAAGQFTISLTVSDRKGRTASASTSVTVQASSSDPAPAPAPDPAPAPSPSGTRDAAVWPFLATSPWNYPIGSNAVYSLVTGNWTGRNSGINSWAWSISMYTATDADPVRNVYDQTNGRTISWRIPTGATTTDGYDRHLNVADPAHSKVLELFGAKPRSDGNWDAYVAIINDLRGPGVYSTWQGTRAYGGSSMGGLIRKGELTNGIPHALAMATGNMAFNRYVPSTLPAYLGPGKAFVWPASSADTGAPYSDIGNLHMGTLLAIPPSVDISKLGITDRRTLNLARALQDYGAYIVDKGGGDWYLGSIFYAELAAQSEAPGGPIPDIDKVTTLLRVVSNNGPTSVGGGGTPRRALAPAFSSTQTSTPSVPLSAVPQDPLTPYTAGAIAVMLAPYRRLRRNRTRRYSNNGRWTLIP